MEEDVDAKLKWILDNLESGSISDDSEEMLDQMCFEEDLKRKHEENYSYRYDRILEEDTDVKLKWIFDNMESASLSGNSRDPLRQMYLDEDLKKMQEEYYSYRDVGISDEDLVFWDIYPIERLDDGYPMRINKVSEEEIEAENRLIRHIRFFKTIIDFMMRLVISGRKKKKKKKSKWFADTLLIVSNRLEYLEDLLHFFQLFCYFTYQSSEPPEEW